MKLSKKKKKNEVEWMQDNFTAKTVEQEVVNILNSGLRGSRIDPQFGELAFYPPHPHPNPSHQPIPTPH